MWKAAAGHNVSDDEQSDDDWETDADFVNNVTEEEQRWGAKTIEGSGSVSVVKMDQLRQDVSKDDAEFKKNNPTQNFSHGYGGNFGVQKDRMDSSAVGTDYQAEKALHSSQTDRAKGYGGKFGKSSVQDKSALGYDAKVDKVGAKHDFASGYGGKFGVQKVQDSAALGWDEKQGSVGAKHDFASGYGGKFGVQKVQDNAAVGFDDVPDKVGTNYDGQQGYGGKFGVTGVQDESAVGWDDKPDKVGTSYDKAAITGSSTGGIKNRFESMAQDKEEEARRAAEKAKEERRKFDEERKAAEAERIAAARAEEAEREAEAATAEAAAEPEPEYEAEPEPEYEATQEPVQEPEPEPEPEPQEQDEWAEEPTADDDDLPGEVVTSEAAGGTGVRARALYDYQAAGDDEITFDPDEIIENIEQVDEGWWLGDARGHRGLFPANYVELID